MIINQQGINKDILTGLYNMNFFEEELSRLDTKRQLPMSIIMGDINGLKLWKSRNKYYKMMFIYEYYSMKQIC